MEQSTSREASNFETIQEIPRIYGVWRLRTALFWVITQQVVAISYRRFGTIIQKWIVEKRDGRLWTRLVWLRTGTNGGLLWGWVL